MNQDEARAGLAAALANQRSAEEALAERKLEVAAAERAFAETLLALDVDRDAAHQLLVSHGAHWYRARQYVVELWPPANLARGTAARAGLTVFEVPSGSRYGAKYEVKCGLCDFTMDAASRHGADSKAARHATSKRHVKAAKDARTA